MSGVAMTVSKSSHPPEIFGPLSEEQVGARDYVMFQFHKPSERQAVEALSVEQARREVEPFVKTPDALEVWSRDFFNDVIGRIEFV